jgi:hypothetical protein
VVIRAKLASRPVAEGMVRSSGLGVLRRYFPPADDTVIT